MFFKTATAFTLAIAAFDLTCGVSLHANKKAAQKLPGECTGDIDAIINALSSQANLCNEAVNQQNGRVTRCTYAMAYNVPYENVSWVDPKRL